MITSATSLFRASVKYRWVSGADLQPTDGCGGWKELRWLNRTFVQSVHQIEVMAGLFAPRDREARRCSSWSAQIEAPPVEDLTDFFTDGRKAVQRAGRSPGCRKKPPLKVLGAVLEVRDVLAHGSRFCEIVTEHARTHDLTAAITHVPAHDAGGLGGHRMPTDPVSRRTRRRCRSSSPRCPTPGWCSPSAVWMRKSRPGWMPTGGRSSTSVASAGGRADNASTASNQISKAERARDVNRRVPPSSPE